MLYDNILILVIFVFLGVFSNDDDLCRLIEFDVPENLKFFQANKIEEKLFYKTNYFCQNKPVFRSLKYSNFYQFQSPNNRWWSLYDTTNSTYQLGTREWCDAWNMKPLLSMPLSIFQHPLNKQKQLQRWKRCFFFMKETNSYTYKSISNIHLKCYYPTINSNCQTQELTFLFDLTETTNNNEFEQMKLLSKTLIWLLYNQTKISLCYYRDTFHLINSFDNKTSIKSLEYLFDSIDNLNQNNEFPKRFSVQWFEAIHNVVTKIYKRRLLLPIHLTKINETISNDDNDDDDEVYTEPYPLIYSDDEAIKTILNISIYSEGKTKRSIKNSYNKFHHLLVILTSRSKYLYDYKKQDQYLAKFISLIPLRILVIDFNKLSNKKIFESFHSTFISNAKYALSSLPISYNYIETYETYGDVIHGNQLFDHYNRLYNLINDCSLLTLFDNYYENLTLKNMFDFTFYQTTDRCFSAPVYRSLADRNLYIQRIANGQWLIIRVDPLLPSTRSLQQKFASTTTSTLSPEFLYATDYANGPMIDDNNETSIIDIPTSVPYCSNTPGIDIIWESDDSLMIDEYSLNTPRQWISNINQSDLISPTCNKYKISCHRIQYDIVILIDIQDDYLSLIEIFLNIFFALIEPFNHRFSLIILSSTTIDTFQYHLPLTTLNNLNKKIFENFFSYIDYKNNSLIQLNEHLKRISEYLINNQQILSSNIQSKQIILTTSSRLNFNLNEMKILIQRYSTIRYMVLDPVLRTDDDDDQNQERENLLRSLTSLPSYANLFWSYSANRDLTFNNVFRILESLCGYLR